MDEERRAYLESILVGGVETPNIVVVEYDSRWPLRYADLATRLAAALGAGTTMIEHIGSTSVPGLAAKPIIDVLVTVPDLDDEPSYGPALADTGLVLRVREDDHRMYRRPDRSAHVHVYADGHEAIPAYLDLRDWLRISAADRRLYGDTKRALAQRPWEDMNDYADAKTAVITEILGRARAARTSGDLDQPC